ncbi:Non-specific lipid-transfer protein 2 [Bienertia sinuspersici]
MACVFAVETENLMVHGQCEGDISGIISQCAKYVKKTGPKTPPSSQCCAVAKKANIPCLCKYVTKDIEQYVSPQKAVYVAQYCGVPFKHGSKCGSKCINSSSIFSYITYFSTSYFFIPYSSLISQILVFVCYSLGFTLEIDKMGQTTKNKLKRSCT